MKKYSFLVCIIMILLLVGCETPHTHEFIEGVCGCGEVDPNYQAHTHNYIEGVCECGKANPHYPKHEHNYVKGVCACGKIYTAPKPDEIIYNEFESVSDFINDYNQRKEEYKYNYVILDCEDIKADLTYIITHMNYGFINEHKPVDGMIMQITPVYIEEIGDCEKFGAPATMYIVVDSYRFTYSSNEFTYEIAKLHGGTHYYVEIYDQSTLISEISIETTPYTHLTKEWILNFVKENIVILK